MSPHGVKFVRTESDSSILREVIFLNVLIYGFGITRGSNIFGWVTSPAH